MRAVSHLSGPARRVFVRRRGLWRALPFALRAVAPGAAAPLPTARSPRVAARLSSKRGPIGSDNCRCPGRERSHVRGAQSLAANLSERARERALSLARDADLRLKAPQGLSGMPTTAGRHRDSRLPPPGTILTRAFRDQAITVHVLDNGFQYDGIVYRSLSAVARHISGTPWNGFSFFRLHSTAVRK